MPDRTKIATCCYCGHRAMLTMPEQGRHELSCAPCGAPLHNLKQLPARAPEPRPRSVPVPKVSRKPDMRPRPQPPRKLKRKKRKKTVAKRLFDWVEDVWDEVEDIFD